MQRSKRIRITLGIAAFLFGLGLCFVGPLIMLTWHSMNQSPIDISGHGHGLENHITSIQDVNRINLVMGLAGIALMCLSVLYVFLEWAVWYIGPSER
jgi:hypothetical protein